MNSARLYRLTGEKKYADWAGEQLDFYADNLARWPVAPPPQKPGDKPGTPVKPGWRLMSQSLDEAVLLIKFVNTARILGDYVTPERKAYWFTKLFQPEAVLLSQSLLTIHNMACWQRSATACVALYYDDAALWKTAIEDRYGVRDLLAKGVTSDYLWREQSLGYNSYVTRALMPLFEFASLKGKADKLQTEMEIVENLLLAPIAMRFPTGQLPSPADGGRQGIAPDAKMLAAASRLFPTKLGIATQQTTLSWESLIDPLPPVTDTNGSEEVTLPPVTSLNMESSRMAILKQGPWQVFFHYGQVVRTHSEAEALHFEAFYDRTDITHDIGTTGYGAPLTQQFMVTGLAHNVPLVDGLGQEGWNPGTLRAFDAAAGRLSASQPQYRKNADAERTLEISGNTMTDTVQVTTTDNQPHELGLLVQIQGKAGLSAGFAPDTSFAGPARPAGFGYWKNPVSAAFTDTASFPVVFPDGRKMRVTIAVPGAFTITHADTPDAPPSRRETLLIRVNGATRAMFKTVWAPETAQ
ncbi:MAG: alginate lyase family protein [Armatimonadota bacterium]